MCFHWPVTLEAGRCARLKREKLRLCAIGAHLCAKGWVVLSLLEDPGAAETGGGIAHQDMMASAHKREA